MFIVTGDNQIKYRNAILFFAKKCAPLTVGKKKLAKLLYYLDFDHFERHLEPVTRAKYMHKTMGPVPDDFDYQLKEMIEERLIKKESRNIGLENPMELIVPLAEPDMSVFSKEELDTLQNVLERWSGASGKTISEQSHKEAPWEATRSNEDIPYQLALQR
jgi:uncharacterized phage-associated protein